MKTIFKSTLLLTCMLMLVQCTSKKETASNTGTTDRKEISKGDPTKNLDIDNSYVWPGSTDPFKVLSAQITDQDSLIVEVEYGGGCKEHIFRLVSNGMMKKSMPPQCTIYLEHENNEDMCRALLRQKVSYYIGNLAKSDETIVIQLFDFNSENTKLLLNAEKK
jgi:hypothetical protein